MFTGLVSESARLKSSTWTGGVWRWVLATSSKLADSASLGDSIAINGTCLTVVAKSPAELTFEISTETWTRTALSRCQVGAKVHVEPSLRVGDPIGGHWVSGHVDGVGKVSDIEELDGCRILKFLVATGPSAQSIAPYLVPKGSIAVDGVSLTVNQVQDTAQGTEFSVCIIPHTLAVTGLGDLFTGMQVNLEADLLAKYISRYHEYSGHEPRP
jgi:riboflavin synthase